MELFVLEHKKIWQKTSTKLCVLLCFVYIVIFGGILSYQWFGFGSHNDVTSAFGNNFDGYKRIRDRQAYANSFSGELTDESLQKLVSDYQKMEALGDDQGLENTDWKRLSNWLPLLFPELKDSSTPKLMISYVDTDKLTGIYERRQKIILHIFHFPIAYTYNVIPCYQIFLSPLRFGRHRASLVSQLGRFAA